MLYDCLVFELDLTLDWRWKQSRQGWNPFVGPKIPCGVVRVLWKFLIMRSGFIGFACDSCAAYMWPDAGGKWWRFHRCLWLLGFLKKWMATSKPIGSMYGIYANIWDILMVNVTIYSIHGSYGKWMVSFWGKIDTGWWLGKGPMDETSNGTRRVAFSEVPSGWMFPALRRGRRLPGRNLCDSIARVEPSQTSRDLFLLMGIMMIYPWRLIYGE